MGARKWGFPLEACRRTNCITAKEQTIVSYCWRSSATQLRISLTVVMGRWPMEWAVDRETAARGTSRSNVDRQNQEWNHRGRMNAVHWMRRVDQFKFLISRCILSGYEQYIILKTLPKQLYLTCHSALHMLSHHRKPPQATESNWPTSRWIR